MVQYKETYAKSSSPYTTVKASMDEQQKSKQNVCIVVPCYSEEKRLDTAVFVKALKEYSSLRFVSWMMAAKITP